MALPGGTVTFVFTDIEGSTRLLQQLGDRYGEVVATHRRILRDSFGSSGGTEIDTQGDAFFFSFARAREAVAGAVDAQRALKEQEWPDGAEVRVRMGLHTGEPTVGEEGYLGLDVVRAARICSAGHGGQILLSETTRALLGNQLPDGASVHDLGEQNLKDIQHERIFQLSIDGGQAEFPPLKAEAPDSAEDDFEKRFEKRIEDYVAGQLERSLGGDKPKDVPAKRSLLWTATSLLEVLLVVATIVAIVLLIKFAF